jgi:PglZ domain-containing protein
LPPNFVRKVSSKAPNMGIVTTALIALLTEHIDRHRVVVWFDPEKAYTLVARALAKPNALANTTFAAYDSKQGFLALRRSLESLWRNIEPPRLLIYVPLSSKDTENALAEYIVAGAHLEPGQPGRYNTRLAIVARHALENTLPATALEKILSDVKTGKLSLTEIESLAERGQESLMGALSLVFESGNIEDIALQFLTNVDVDHDLTAKAAGPALANLLNESLDVNMGTGDDLSSLRVALTRHLLTVEFILSIAAAVPASLKTIPLPKSLAARKTAVDIVRTWRQRRDLAGNYISSAQKLEAELGLGSLEWSIPALQPSETFQRTEIALQLLVEQALIHKKASQDLLDLAMQRLGSFWSTEKPEIKLRWQVIVDAAQVLLHAQSTQQALKGDLAANVLFKRYTSSEQPWCMLDTFQRHLERDAHNLDSDPHTGDSSLKLVATAQRAYAQTTDSLASRFVHAYEKGGFTLAGITQQVEIYHDFVEPAAGDSPIAYFLIDAFRYEMARELLTLLPEDWKAELTPALATPPSITEVGMAALMPRAERGISIVPTGASKLGVTVSETTLKNRPDRVKWLGEKGTKPVTVTELNKIAPLKDKHLLAEIKNARLIVITASDEIDGLWENQPHMARQLHDHVFEQLRRGMRSLFGLGISKVIITADHGFLMGDHLMQGESLDAPGGETADLHRRVWIGKGGAAIGECLRKPLSAFGISGDLELVTPYGMTSFKVQGGSNEYFHGGLSLQEVAIPVISITVGKTKPSLGMPPFSWSIKPGSQKITTRFFTVTVEAQTNTPDLFSVLPRVRVEMRAGSQAISVPVSASYGFNEVTRDVTMRYDENNPGHLASNAITLQITDVPELDSVTLYLLDEVGASLCPEIKLPLEIAF